MPLAKLYEMLNGIGLLIIILRQGKNRVDLSKTNYLEVNYCIGKRLAIALSWWIFLDSDWSNAILTRVQFFNWELIFLGNWNLLNKGESIKGVRNP